MIKRNWQFYYASKHVWQTIKLSRHLPEDVRTTAIDPCIQTNGYALHPENLMVTMLSDSRKTVRARAVELIKKALPNGEERYGMAPYYGGANGSALTKSNDAKLGASWAAWKVDIWHKCRRTS